MNRTPAFVPPDTRTLYTKPADTKKNRRLAEQGKKDDRILVYRTKGEYWGKERAVVVTHNPATARKQSYTLDSKLEDIRQELLSMRSRVRDKMPHWRDPEVIKEILEALRASPCAQ